MAKSETKFLLLFFFSVVILPVNVTGQLMNHYWAQSYNSISTLLSGAVVGEGSGNAAIYYNPSAIVDLEDGNNISVAASIFTFNTYGLKNVMGPGDHITSSNLLVQPQFLSYGVKSPFKKWSFELAVFNRLREDMNLYYAGSEEFEIPELTHIPNRLNRVFSYRNYYTDSWIGLGGGYSYSERLSFGTSLNISISSLKYNYDLSATVYPLLSDTALLDESTALLARNEVSESIDFTNIRLIAKFGATYRFDNANIGMCISLPAIKLFSVGKKASKGVNEVYSPELDPDNDRLNYYIFDHQNGKQLKTNFRLPFSIALGFAYSFTNTKKIYFTSEYFASTGSYKLVDAQMNSNITTDNIYNQLENKNWLTYEFKARPVFNLALGYQWEVKENVLLLMGIRTDFNSIRQSDINSDYLKTGLYSTTSHNYHATTGVKFNLKKHLLIAGTQLTFGRQKDLLQVSNYGSVDNFFDNKEVMPLMGIRERNVRVNQFSISLFLGATLNFESKSSRKSSTIN
ncbi:MAG: hypothetical protein C0598_07500 [Marinilabiliales bacterium]|nr:MAG: hypothetical protein C0598_07500 [Marinilabiliales bacterium]